MASENSHLVSDNTTELYRKVGYNSYFANPGASVKEIHQLAQNAGARTKQEFKAFIGGWGEAAQDD